VKTVLATPLKPEITLAFNTPFSFGFSKKTDENFLNPQEKTHFFEF